MSSKTTTEREADAVHSAGVRYFGLASSERSERAEISCSPEDELEASCSVRVSTRKSVDEARTRRAANMETWDLGFG